MRRKFSLAFQLALRELRHGWKHFAVFMVCLTLGVAVIGVVGSFSFTVEEALQGKAQSLLGGDVEVSVRGIGANDVQQEFLGTYGRLSYVSTMRAMLHRDDSVLVELKAIDDAYPLLGKLEFNEPILRQEVFAGRGVAVDAALLSRLSLNLGDEVRLGNAMYTIKATIKFEPDRAVQIFSFGPRVMLSHAALAESGLVNTFSLIQHRYRITTPKNAIVDEKFEERIEDTLRKRFPEISWRVRTGTDGNRTVQRFLDQLLSFLTLSGLATFLIAGIGIGSAVRAYLEKKSQTIAVLKTLGAARVTVLNTYVMVLAVLVLLGGLAGIMVALIIIGALMPLVTAILPVVEGYSSLRAGPLMLALWYGALISYLFSMPALLGALNVRPSLLFRSRSSAISFTTNRSVYAAMFILGILLLVTLLMTAQDVAFILGAAGVVLLAFAVFALCAVCVRVVARRIKSDRPWLRLALGNLHRPGSTTGTVIFAIGISLTVLIALILTEVNFQTRIQRTAEEEAPSLFMIDIQTHQRAALYELLLQYATPEQIVIYPMVRGHISAINGKPVREEDVDEDVRWAVRGDRGLSTSIAPPENAKIVAGRWWPADYQGAPLLSVDERFIRGMNLKLGDIMTLNVLGEEINAKVASAREIDYGTFQINFAMMLSPGIIDNFPRTHLATVHLGQNLSRESVLVKKIADMFPGVTAIRTTEVVDVVRDIVQNIALALRVTVAVSLCAGVLVLISALGATIEQRLYDTAVLKVLGARKRDILKSCTAEWMLLALVTSLIAASIGTFSAWLIAIRFRVLEFHFLPEVTLVTIFACIIVIGFTGYFGNRRLFQLRPAGLLRNE